MNLTDTSKLPALQIHINGFDENSEQILPFIADSNYITLMPGEPPTLTATYEPARRQGVATIVRVDGFNVVTTFATTFTDLEALITEFSTNPDVTAGLNNKLAAAATSPNKNARDNQLEAFINQVNAQTGKALTAAQAQTPMLVRVDRQGQQAVARTIIPDDAHGLKAKQLAQIGG